MLIHQEKLFACLVTQIIRGFKVNPVLKHDVVWGNQLVEVGESEKVYLSYYMIIKHRYLSISFVKFKKCNCLMLIFAYNSTLVSFFPSPFLVLKVSGLVVYTTSSSFGGGCLLAPNPKKISS